MSDRQEKSGVATRVSAARINMVDPVHIVPCRAGTGPHDSRELTRCRVYCGIESTMETIQVVLDAKLLKAADVAAKRQKVNRSALIRQALQEHLQATAYVGPRGARPARLSGSTSARGRVSSVGGDCGLAGRLNRGDVYLCRFPSPDNQRPVLILTRDSAIGHLATVTVAPITSTVRDVPSEVKLDVDDGMKGRCAVNLHNAVTITQERLGKRVASLSHERMQEVCAALRFSLGCG